MKDKQNSQKYLTRVLYSYPDPDPSIRLCSSCGGEYTMHEINYYEKEDMELCEGCDYHD